MTSRDRLMNTLNHEPVDRPPIWLLFPHHPLSCYVDVHHLACYQPVMKVAKETADIFDRRTFGKGFCCSTSPDISYRSETVSEAGQTIRRSIISYRGTQLTHEVSTGSNGTYIKPYVTDISQLDAILDMPYVPPRPSLDTWFSEEAELGDKGLMMADCGDALGFIYSLTSVSDFAVWCLLEREAITRFTDEMHRRMMDFYTYLLDNGVGPVYFIVGAEFAGPPVVSPAFFKELSGRYVKDLVDLIRSYKMKSIVHYHGNLHQILPAMAEVGADGLHTIEAPPIGDCTLTQAREALGETVLIGNIQYDDLRRLSELEIREQVRSCMEETQGKSFILSPTAGPYEAVIDDVMQRNYIAFMEAGIEYGKAMMR